MKTWKMFDTATAEYVGYVEIEDNTGEYHVFEIPRTDTHLVFGGTTNIGFLESGNMELDLDFSLDENLQELVEDLETYSNQGAEFMIHIVCNDRM